MTEQNHTSVPAGSDDNPLLQDWTGPFETPPFNRIAPEHFRPAFDRGFAEHDAAVAAIATNPAVPTFDNTIAALERADALLDRVSSVFGILSGAHTNDKLLELERELSPRRAKHWSAILLNEPLFRRIDTL